MLGQAPFGTGEQGRGVMQPALGSLPQAVAVLQLIKERRPPGLGGPGHGGGKAGQGQHLGNAAPAALFGGAALGIAAACSGSLVPGMAFHLYNNTLAFAGQYCQQYGAPQIICYLLMFLPPLAALAFAPWRALPRRGAGRLRGQGRELLRLLRSPGYLTALAVLAALSLFKTIGG